MGKIIRLREAINLIWETVKITEEQDSVVKCPYLFIVGAGVSVPEIVPASGIVQDCQKKVEDLYGENEDELKRIFEESETLEQNSAAYYSYWFGQAYKNKIHRQQYLKKIINEARISTSNLLLAQVLTSKQIGTTVITPNFDNQLLRSLNLLGNYNVFSANNVLDNVVLVENSEEIQIMHVHGTYQFYDCCNLQSEITKITMGQGIRSTAGTIEEFLKNRAPIVIGYSGWEDDVIMSKIKDRLQYALPYNLIWFCYSRKDYEVLPVWLKESEDVVFVLPDMREEEENISNTRKEEIVLSAEDVLTALITKFNFKALNLFSNPIQYYIELIDGFLPQDAEIFPVKSWKRRLDYIEEQLDDVERKIIALDDAAARKDVIDATKLLREMDDGFITVDDLEHIFNGIILPLLSSKNRIEDGNDLFKFLNVIVDLLLKRVNDIKTDDLKKYLRKILDALFNYRRGIEKNDAITVYDKILMICKENDKIEEVELGVLGIKSDIADDIEKLKLQNEIIERGMKRIENAEIARLVLFAVSRQIENQGMITERQRKTMERVVKKHIDDKELLELYYYEMIDFYSAGMQINIKIDDLIKQIVESKMPDDVLLHVYWAKCQREDDIKNRVAIACEALEIYNQDEISNCQGCLAYAYLLSDIIRGKVFLEELVEQRYIKYAKQLCYEEGCGLVSQIVVVALYDYILSIQSQFEKQELCRNIIEICNRSKLYKEWAYFSGMYVEFLEKNDKEAYLNREEKYRNYCKAEETMTIAIDAYVNHDVCMCRDLLLEVSEIFDEVFEGKYNPALLNICFLVRRGEAPELEISVLEVLNKITWMSNSAFLNINKALAYLQINDWESARREIDDIEDDLDGALQWWMQEEVVGIAEKNMVLLLLILENKLEKEIAEIRGEEFWKYCEECIAIPENIKKSLMDRKPIVL